MSDNRTAPKSLSRRLVGQVFIGFAVLAFLLFFSTRYIAETAVQASQDNILAASVTAILEETSLHQGKPTVDIPYGAFAMLGAVGDDLVFYRIDALGLGHVTGYDDLPLPSDLPDAGTSTAYNLTYGEASLRAVAATKTLASDDRQIPVLVSVAQTRDSQAEIISAVANASAIIGIGFLVLAVSLTWAAMRNAMSPLRAIAELLDARGPKDLEPIKADPPKEVAPMVDALNHYLTRTQGTLDQMEEFIAEGAHRIRTPLAGVRAQAEIAMRNAQQERTREAFRKILLAVDHTARSAGQMLDQAMAAYRADRWQPEELDMSEVVQTALDDVKISADLKDIEFDLSLADHPISITGDPILLTEALKNLLDNAIKYSPAETVITVRLREAAGGVSVAILDQGPGIPQEELGLVRERFARGSNAGETIGSGLGLNIVEVVIRAHNGSLDLSTSETGGLRATVHLPGGGVS